MASRTGSGASLSKKALIAPSKGRVMVVKGLHFSVDPRAGRNAGQADRVGAQMSPQPPRTADRIWSGRDRLGKTPPVSPPASLRSAGCGAVDRRDHGDRMRVVRHVSGALDDLEPR